MKVYLYILIRDGRKKKCQKKFQGHHDASLYYSENNFRFSYGGVEINAVCHQDLLCSSLFCGMWWSVSGHLQILQSLASLAASTVNASFMKKSMQPSCSRVTQQKICTSGLATSLKRCSPQSERTTMCQPAHGTTAHDNAWVSQRGCTYELEKPTCRSVS